MKSQFPCLGTAVPKSEISLSCFGIAVPNLGTAVPKGEISVSLPRDRGSLVRSRDFLLVNLSSWWQNAAIKHGFC
jgi:hypothetical protein